MMKAGVPNAVNQGGEMMREQQKQGAQQNNGN